MEKQGFVWVNEDYDNAFLGEISFEWDLVYCQAYVRLINGGPIRIDLGMDGVAELYVDDITEACAGSMGVFSKKMILYFKNSIGTIEFSVKDNQMSGGTIYKHDKKKLLEFFRILRTNGVNTYLG